MRGSILFVDDEANILHALERLFVDDDGLSVRTAPDGPAALKLLEESPADLVISDHVMPGMDGIELLSKIRGLYPDTRYMMLTGYGHEYCEAIVDTLGRDIDIIGKPWDSDQLRAKVRKILLTGSTTDERQTLLEIEGLTEDLIARAERVQKKLQNPKPLVQVLREMGKISDEAFEKMESKRRARLSLAEILHEDGALTDKGFQDYQDAHEISPNLSERELLLEAGAVEEEPFLRALALKLGFAYTEPEIGTLDSELLGKSSIRYLMRLTALPVRIDGGKLIIIVADPQDTTQLHELERIYGVPVDVHCCVASRIQDTLETLERLSNPDAIDAESLQYREISDPSESEDVGQEAVHIVDYLLLRAIQLGASDLHIEPMQKKMGVRVRVDGVLQHLTDLPIDIAPRVSSRIKILAGCDISEKRLHQDGKIFVKAEGSEIDIRVSTYVTIYGEVLVLRLLDRSKNLVTLDKIGFAPRVRSVIEDIVLRTSSGLVLVTGPTGSGKTTTLYSIVDFSLDPAEKVITCEDPVEYVLDGVVQCSVNQKTGPTFSDSLRAMLRQDPDTILVGEVRDSTTANLAFEAALTGHKVYSTFHTEDAVTVIIRLLEMSVEPFLIASSLSAIVAQRLLRRLCVHCRVPTPPARAELRFLGLEKKDFRNIKVMGPQGCAECDNSGYKGRLGIHELVIPDEAFKEAILRRDSAKELRVIARNLSEFLTLQEDALLKVSQGLTSLDEIVSSVPRDTRTRDFDTLAKVAGMGETK